MKLTGTKPTSTDLGAEYIAVCRKQLLNEFLPRFKASLDALDEGDIWWRAHETDNSIGNLMLHLSGNIRQWIVAGLGGEAFERDRPAEFSERGPIPKAELLKQFQAALDDADRVLAQFDPSLLLEVRHFQKWDHTCLYAISHVVEHFSHHLGQIIYITKLRTAKDLKLIDL
jgi:uncharacterized damage-inducible protein DinB